MAQKSHSGKPAKMLVTLKTAHGLSGIRMFKKQKTRNSKPETRNRFSVLMDLENGYCSKTSIYMIASKKIALKGRCID